MRFIEKRLGGLMIMELHVSDRNLFNSRPPGRGNS